MNKSLLSLSLLLVLSSTAMASAISDEALKYIPGGKVVSEKADEVKVQGPNGTIIEIEFNRSGKFDEASGDSVEQDVFVPGNDILSLKEAVAALKKEGKSAVGEWSIDNSMIRGWYYEFEGFEEGKKMDYTIDGKSGKLLSVEIDD